MQLVALVLAAAISLTSAHANIGLEARTARALAAAQGSYEANGMSSGSGGGKEAASDSSSGNIIVGKPGSQPQGQSPITAAAGSLPLGAKCSDSRQCANGVDCWGTTSFTIRECGNFNAACKSSSQCAYNLCEDGLCKGFKKPAANATTPSTPTGSAVSAAPYYPTATTGPYKPVNTTTPIVPFTGDASLASLASGFAALFFGVIAWIA